MTRRNGESEVAGDLATVTYANLAGEWRRRAAGCRPGAEQDLFLTIADGYAQLASLLDPPNGSGEQPLAGAAE